jgi:hypothetical protein
LRWSMESTSHLYPFLSFAKAPMSCFGQFVSADKERAGRNGIDL